MTTPAKRRIRNDMSDQELNAAIAEKCGHWRNYCGDLNAMAEAEMALGDSHQYLIALSAICMPHHAIHATARQRAEAFARTVGIWKE